MINLCVLFGVEEKEEFKIIHRDYKHFVYTISNNILWCKDKYAETFTRSSLYINNLNEFTEIIKLPKKKQFTDDELAIMRSLPKKYEWVARDSDGTLYAFYFRKPKKENGCWDNAGRYRKLGLFGHLFNSITSEDEEPVFIDDYVERGTK